MRRQGGEHLVGTKNDDPIGGIKNTDKGEQKLNQKTKEAKKQRKPFPSMDIRLMMRTRMNDDVKHDTPSSGENVKQLVGKQMNVDELNTAPPVGIESEQSDTSDAMKTDAVKCEYKRGGYCMKHGTKGVKSKIKSQVWCKQKSGLYGYSTKVITNYSCETGTAVVMVPNLSERYDGVASALGGAKSTQGDVQIKNRVSGEGLVRAGASMSESEGIMSENTGTEPR